MDNNSAAGKPRMKRVHSLDDVCDWSDNDDLDTASPWATQIGRKIKRANNSKAIGKHSTNVDRKDALRNGITLDLCIECKLACTKTKCLQCSLCDDCFHPTCCGADSPIIVKNIAIVKAIGWSCNQCKKDLRNLLGNFRSGSLTTDTDTSSSRIKTNTVIPSTAERQSGAEGLTAAVASDRPSTQVMSDAPGPRDVALRYSDVMTVVSKSISDASRRKRNVIISGLPETTNQDEDLRSVAELCDSLLQMNIRSKVKSAKRLGKGVSNKPRRLLVILTAESVAEDILSRARSLRNASDSYVSRNVFINRDLAPEEARLEYERRLARRRARDGPSGTVGSGQRGGEGGGQRGGDGSGQRGGEGSGQRGGEGGGQRGGEGGGQRGGEGGGQRGGEGGGQRGGEGGGQRGGEGGGQRGGEGGGPQGGSILRDSGGDNQPRDSGRAGSAPATAATYWNSSRTHTGRSSNTNSNLIICTADIHSSHTDAARSNLSGQGSAHDDNNGSISRSDNIQIPSQNSSEVLDANAKDFCPAAARQSAMDTTCLTAVEATVSGASPLS
jgi:hypothetical protein